jgi:hypothetical protein
MAGLHDICWNYLDDQYERWKDYECELDILLNKTILRWKDRYYPGHTSDLLEFIADFLIENHGFSKLEYVASFGYWGFEGVFYPQKIYNDEEYVENLDEELESENGEICNQIVVESRKVLKEWQEAKKISH